MPTARATIIDPVSVSAERQAQTWLAGIDAERETRAAVAVLNRVLYAHRIATADPHTHEVSPAQALVIRAGWGEGKQLADGYWQHARELPWVSSARAQRRAAVLRPDERLAELLGARSGSSCARSSPCARGWTSTTGARTTPRSSSTRR